MVNTDNTFQTKRVHAHAAFQSRGGSPGARVGRRALSKLQTNQGPGAEDERPPVCSQVEVNNLGERQQTDAVWLRVRGGLREAHGRDAARTQEHLGTSGCLAQLGECGHSAPGQGERAGLPGCPPPFLGSGHRIHPVRGPQSRDFARPRSQLWV